MSERLTVEEVVTIEDTDVLWRALLAAKAQTDAPLVRAIEGRMPELSHERRFAHLSDEELRAQIQGLTGSGEPENLLPYSPASGEGHEGAADIAALNRMIRANQRVGVGSTLAAFVDEWNRRKR